MQTTRRRAYFLRVILFYPASHHCAETIVVELVQVLRVVDIIQVNVGGDVVGFATTLGLAQQCQSPLTMEALRTEQAGHCQALAQIETDVGFISVANATMQLDGFLGDVAASLDGA